MFVAGLSFLGLVRHIKLLTLTSQTLVGRP